MYYGGFTYSESAELSIPLRMWFIKRLLKELSQRAGTATNEQHGEKISSGPQVDNSIALMGRQMPPEVAAIMGKQNPYGPARNKKP